MSDTYHCPRCGAVPRRLTRNLDFFCEACHTALTILDPERAQVVSLEDAQPYDVPTSACHSFRSGRGSPPRRDSLSA